MKQAIQAVLSVILSIAVLFTAPAAFAEEDKWDSVSWELNRNLFLGAAQVRMADYCNPSAGKPNFNSCEDAEIGYMAGVRFWYDKSRKAGEKKVERRIDSGWYPELCADIDKSQIPRDDWREKEGGDGKWCEVWEGSSTYTTTKDVHEDHPLTYGIELGYTWVPDGFDFSGDTISGDGEYHSAHAVLRGSISPWWLGLTAKVGGHYSKLNSPLLANENEGWHHGFVFGGGLRVWRSISIEWERRINDEIGDVDMISISLGRN